MKKRILSIILVLAMCLTLVPMTAFATGTEEGGGKTLPYSFDFETDMVAEGWTNIDADGDGQDWITATNIYGAEGWGVEGSRCAISQSYDNNLGEFNADNWLFSPAITIPEGGATVSWYEQSQDVSYPDFYEVYVSETNTSTDTSKMTKIFSGIAANPWNQRSVELEAAEYAGKTVYIAFRHKEYDEFYLEIDNFAAFSKTVNKYTVTFDANDGSVTPTSAETGTDGKLATLPTPTRSGSYSFDGWYTMKEGGTKVDTNTVFTAAATIYAHWSRSFSFADLPETGVTNITVSEGDYDTHIAVKDAFILFLNENIKTDGKFVLVDCFDVDVKAYHMWIVSFENDVISAMDGGYENLDTILYCVNDPTNPIYDWWINGTFTAIHTHAFTYTANNGKITATCVDGCDDGYDTNPLTLTLTAPTSLVYDGSAKVFTFADGEADTWTGAGLELPTFEYYLDKPETPWLDGLDGDPIAAAEGYVVMIRVGVKAAQVEFNIDKATPYIKTTPAPNDIEYGKKLSDSTLFGGYVQISSTDSSEVGGLFEWTNPDTVPDIDDSEITEYDVTFTPADTNNYNTVSCKVKIKVTHIHNLIKVTGQAPTETASGFKDYYECKDSDDACHEYFEDATGLIPIENLDAWKSSTGNGYIAPLLYTIGDILATAEDFPTSAANGWVTDSGCFCHVAGSSLAFKDSSVSHWTNISTSESLSKFGNDYFYSDAYKRVTFKMSGAVLQSITFEDLSGGAYSFAVGEYKPGPVAKILETGLTYETVQKAVNAAAKNQTVQMLADSAENITVEPWKNLTLDLNGKTLTGTGTQSVIKVSGTLTLKDGGDGGKITGNNSTGKGGGVRVFSEGSFIMNSGTITGISAQYGGGVYNEGSFIMNGGVITGNTASDPDHGVGSGGGVDNEGVFTMNGGTISGNTALNSGGGVFSYGSFTMNGGTITGNSAQYGGGVYFANGNVTLGGTAKITGNTKSGDTTKNNLYLPDGKTATIGTDDKAPITTGETVMQVGVTMQAPGKFTTNGTADDAKWFTSDNADYEVIFNTDHLELSLKTIPSTTIADILPADFPTTAENGWVNENGLKMYSDTNLAELTMFAPGKWNLVVPHTAEVAPSGDNYVYDCTGAMPYTMTFVMENDVLVKVIVSGSPMAIHDGTYAPETYIITFNMNGHGTQVDPQTVEAGNKATKPATDPVADGWTFGGWYADATFNATFDFDAAINANTTVYAKWTENTDPQPHAYTIVAGANSEWTEGGTAGLLITSDALFAKFSSVKIDGSTIAASNYIAEEGSTKITLAPAYLKTLSVGTHSIEIVSNDGRASTNFTIKAAVPPVPTSYIVSFNMNGHGTQITAQTVESGSKAIKPADPTANGYTFDGWYADAAFSAKFDFNTTITENTTVYAKWAKNSAAPTGDNSHLFLWIVLLLASSGALVGTTVYGNKKEKC